MSIQYDENLVIGKVIEVDGTHIIIEMDSNIDELSKIYQGDIYQIGQFGSIIKIYFGRKIIYAYVSRLRMKNEYEAENSANNPQNSSSSERVIEADLFGEGEWIENGLEFERGISTYPLPQQRVYLTTKQELNYIFGKKSDSSLIIGHHVSSEGTSASVHINELLNKHSAILGSTGSGKSGTVSAIIHSILNYGMDKKLKNWHPNIIILDPHNEYSSAFSEKQYDKLSTDQGNLKLPYWLFNLQETINLFIGKKERAATFQTNILKKALLKAREESKNILSISSDITVDSPLPYDIDKLKNLIDADPNKPSQPSKQDSYLKIIEKINILKDDARYNFMMDNWESKKDDFYTIVQKIISGGKPVKIIDLSGIPNDVASIASSVIARMIFMIKVWQSSDEREKNPILFVCEEAHRYIPSKGEAMYESAQEAIRRIAKEGRKYGIGIMLISQRPSELEPTVMSQCNSWIVLRITNENDTNHVRSMLPDSLSSLTKVLPSLRQREAIIIGQAVAVPSRVLINELKPEHLPRSNDIRFDEGWKNKHLTQKQIESIRDRWRFQKLQNS